jgi:transcriptional regulator with XRE-family HTH domain
MRMKKVTQQDIAKICKLDQGSISRILNRDTRDSFAPETVARVFKVARELGYLHPALVSSNRRAGHRRKIRATAAIRIVIGMNTLWDEGTAEIHEISPSGCVLTNFQTRKNSMPLDRFRIDLEVRDGKLAGFSARARLVRFAVYEDVFAVAVSFENLTAEQKELLRASLK